MDDERVLNSEVYPIDLMKEYPVHSILDIGGGGEGVIGKLYGKSVVAIDIRRDELEACENESIKIVMDATNMHFLDHTFDIVTSFYSMMYMTTATQEKVMNEVFRVLKPGGIFELWDLEIPPYDGTIKDIFVANLSVKLEGVSEIINVGYGVLMDDNGQNENTLKQLAIKSGFIPFDREFESGHFNLKFEKKNYL